jgi:putative ABC transport system substrate-binding protein
MFRIACHRAHSNRGALLLFSLACLTLAFTNCSREKVQTIGITQIVSHPSLDSVREGTLKGLADRGFEDGKNIRVVFRNANGDASLTLPIAQEFVRSNVAVIVPISTPSALAAAKSTNTIPIVFGGVTDPVGAGLVKDVTSPGGNITGTSDRWPFRQQLEFFTKLLPRMRKLGILYKPGDDVSKIAVDAIRENGPSFNLQVVAQPVSGPADVYPAAQRLFQDVDAIYTGLDNLIVENLQSVLKAAREANKPVLSGDEGSVEKGALAAFSVSMRDLGIATGNMVADVLQGKATASMPVQVITTGKGVVNLSTADDLKIDRHFVQELGADTK